MTFDQNGVVNAFGMDLGFRNVNGGDLSGVDGSTGVQYHYPIETQTMDVQLYRYDPSSGEELPLGNAAHLGPLSNGFVGFVSTDAFDQVVIAQTNDEQDDELGYEIPDPYQMGFDNVRFGTTPTLPTNTYDYNTHDANSYKKKAGDFVLTLSAAAATDLEVAYTAKGSAVNGVDYEMLKGKAKIKAGKTTKKIPVVPAGNPANAGKKVVKLTLQSGTGYLVGTPDPVKVKITSGQ